MPAQPSAWAKFNSRFADLCVGGLERCRRQGGVINVVIRVLFNVYVLTRRKRVCVGVGGGWGIWHRAAVIHLVILDSSWRNGSNHGAHTCARTHKHTVKRTHLANYANQWLGRGRCVYSVFREQ